jgi:oligosaccharide translocation protein RFT1
MPAGVAAVVELLAEPFYIIASTQLRFGLRAGIDTAAMMLRGAVTLALLLQTRMSPAAVFSAAQLAFAGTYFLGYLAFAAALYTQVRGIGGLESRKLAAVQLG